MTLLSRIAELLRYAVSWRGGAPRMPLSDMFERFQKILEENNTAMKIISDMEDKLGGEYVFDRKYLQDSIQKLEEVVLKSAVHFNSMSGNRHLDIYGVVESLGKQLQLELAGQMVIPQRRNVFALEDIRETMEEVVGNKAYNLSRVRSLPNANVPKGFVVTISGFRNYLAYNNLFDKIEALLESGRRDIRLMDSVSSSIRLLILGGDIPPDLRRDILKAAEKIFPERPEAGFYSVRSSAVGEDGIMSFAGLHDSFLNVPFRELLSSYKKVLAGLYSPAGLEYRIHRQVPATDMAMAVLYQKMVDSRTSGVAYTIDPNTPREQICLLGAGWGLGKVVVEGRNPVDSFRVSRNPPHTVVDSRISEKRWMLTPFETRQGMDVPPEQWHQPCLTDLEVTAVVETALVMERYFKRPLDIEWSKDTEGRLWILQARPLGVPRGSSARGPELKALLAQYPVLMSDQGVIAYRGIGAGPVWVIEEDETLERFPSGAVLVSRYALPLLARVIPRASAVITDVGSPTGHMATVAREFRVPTIVDAGNATRLLKKDQVVTVDAERNVVYDGRIEELLHHQLLERASFDATYEFQLLRRLLKRIAPLTLIDPEDAGFTPRGCRSIHDVLRFIHEKATQTLAQIAEDPGFLRVRGGRRLKTDIPLNLLLIDIGGGFVENIGKSGWATPEQIASLPMKALWEGMRCPDVWNTEPVSADFKGFMSSMTRTQAAAVSGQGVAGLNVAVLGANYLNLSLRVGYHFTMVDSHVGPEREKNSIFFRFLGGATDISRRSRRAALLLSILEKIGFKVEGKGDLVLARSTNAIQQRSEEYLHLIGRLIGFARQLDILMTDDAAVESHFERFMAACNMNFSGPYMERRDASDEKQTNNLDT